MLSYDTKWNRNRNNTLMTFVLHQFFEEHILDIDLPLIRMYFYVSKFLLIGMHKKILDHHNAQKLHTNVHEIKHLFPKTVLHEAKFDLVHGWSSCNKLQELEIEFSWKEQEMMSFPISLVFAELAIFDCCHPWLFLLQSSFLRDLWSGILFHCSGHDKYPNV